MPQRKNPTPKRVARCVRPAPEDDTASASEEQQKVSLPDDPILLREFPKESLYQENEVDCCSVASSDKDESGRYVCQKCGRPYSTKSGLRYHLQHTCKKVNRYRYTCLVCNHQLTELEETLNHIAEEHLGVEPSRRRRTRVNKSYLEQVTRDEHEPEKADFEEFIPSDGDEELDDDFDIADDDDEDLSEKKERSSSYTPKHSSKIMPSAKSSFATIQQPFYEALQWLFDFVQPLEKKYKICYPSLVPDFEKWVKNLNFNLSMYKKSPSFKVAEEEKRSFLHECDGIEPLKASTTSNDFAMNLNAGGPVHAMSWCPVPIKEHGSSQILAVSSHSGLHATEQCYHEEGLIQIWDCGKLDLHGHGEQTPEFLFGISCNETPIWELKWCHFGRNTSCKKGSDSAKSRLGILAAACASGRVLVLAVPDIAASDVDPGSNIFEAMPKMVLLPSFEGKDQREKIFGQCLSVDWTLSDGGEWVAGGYSKGMVALWKMKDPSSFLLSQESGCSHLVACRTFLAHNKAVQSLCWCPYDASVLATGGLDRYLKIWNSGHAESPIMTSSAKISAITEISWPILWCGVFTGTEDVFASPWFHGLLYHDALTQLVGPYSLIPFKSTCLTHSFSNWMNCIVAGDSAGSAVVHANSNWNRKIRHAKVYARVQLFHTEVKWVSKESGEETTLNDVDRGKYQLLFHDTNLQKLKDIEKRSCFKNARTQDGYPACLCDKPYVQAVNKLAWNPNFGSHTWIAAGLQCGLIRLYCVRDMHSETMDSIVQDLKKELR